MNFASTLAANQKFNLGQGRRRGGKAAPQGRLVDFLASRLTA